MSYTFHGEVPSWRAKSGGGSGPAPAITVLEVRFFIRVVLKLSGSAAAKALTGADRTIDLVDAPVVGVLGLTGGSCCLHRGLRAARDAG
jgi:hypothetical protein